MAHKRVSIPATDCPGLRSTRQPDVDPLGLGGRSGSRRKADKHILDQSAGGRVDDPFPFEHQLAGNSATDNGRLHRRDGWRSRWTRGRSVDQSESALRLYAADDRSLDGKYPAILWPAKVTRSICKPEYASSK